ncbi:cupin domain-containing protein [Hyphomicrobium sp.]|uniref:cupin domain-containing protein n=1 Tax=Hyphomicrobium sp. TaxID=82 RepID=UPI003F71A8DB
MSHAPGYRHLKYDVIEVDFYRTQVTAFRGAAMRDALKLTASFRIAVSTVAIGLALAAAASVPKVLAQAGDGHTIVGASDIKWSPAPPSIPPGAQAAVLYGDPGKEGLFVLRLKLPKGYRLAPHTHPKPEIVTVISGTFQLGMGETADQSKAKPLGAGSFLAMPPGMAHFGFTDEDTVIQLNSTGPWTLTYVNPNDDPRKKTQ